MEENENKAIGTEDSRGIGKLKDAVEKQEKARNFFKIISKIPKPVLIVGLIILVAMVVIIMLAAFFHVIKKDQHSTITSSYSSAIGGGTSLGGTSLEDDEDTEDVNQTITIKPGTDGKYEILFDIPEDAVITVEDLLQEKHITGLTDENINFISALVANGFKLDYYQEKEQLQSLLLFFKAEIASQSLDLRTVDEMYPNGIDGEYNTPSLDNFEEEGIPGIVTIKRYRAEENNTGDNINAEILEYMPKTEFDSIQNYNNTNYFTINEVGDLVLANTYEETIKYEYNGHGEDIAETTYTPKKNTVQYKALISKSTLPFNLMATMMVYVDSDPNFYNNVAKTVENSKIVLALKEEKTKIVETTNSTYIPREEKYYDFSYEVSYTLQEETQNVIYEADIDENIALTILQEHYHYPEEYTYVATMLLWDYQGTTYLETYKNGHLRVIKKVSAQQQETNNGDYHPWIPELENGKLYTTLEFQNDNSYETIKTVTTTSYTQELEVKEVKNWFMEYNIESYMGSAEEISSGDIPAPIEDENYLDYLGVPKIPNDNGESYENFGTTPIDIVGKQANAINDAILRDFAIAKQQEIGGSSPYMWTISGNIYKNIKDIETSKITRTNTTTTTITTGETFQEYREAAEVGSFLYYFDKSPTAQGVFNSVSGMVFQALETDVETLDQVEILKYLLYLYTGKEEFNVAVDLNSLVGTMEFMDFGEYNQVMSLEDYAKQFIEDLNTDYLDLCKIKVDTKLPIKKTQQKYALIVLYYKNSGSIDLDFLKTNIYGYTTNIDEPDSDDLKLIWDEWWFKEGLNNSSTALEFRKQDALFETYVKGTYDFNNSWSPTGEPKNGGGIDSRIYYLFYTEAQKNQFNNANLTTQRPAHEEEIFEYKEVSNLVMNIIEIAISKVGCPYTNAYPGRTGPNSFDCSGLIYYLYYLQNGISVPSSTAGYKGEEWDRYMVYQNSNGLTDTELQNYLLPGDVLIKLPPKAGEHGHAALYIGNDEIIHAVKRTSGDRVVQENIYSYGKRNTFTRIYRFWNN